jgi:dolichol-phosphate mannosyltransferase
MSPEGSEPEAKPTVFGVILARNEAHTVGEIVRAAKPFVDQVVVVDGHSTDATREIAQREGARVVLDHGRGKGDGIRTAIDLLDAEILVFLDADGSHDPADIPRMVAPILDGSHDLVIGSRGRGGSDELHGDLNKLLRMIGSDIILLIINYRFDVRLTDSQNGFRAIRRDVGRRLGLREKITTIEQEMTIKCLKKGFRVGEIATHEYARRSGRSSIRLGRVWFRYIWSVVKNIF